MIRTIRKLRERASYQRLLTKNIHANQLMQTLTSEGKYFPTTAASLNAHSLATVINEIVINGRKSVIEFGSGLSTLMMARLIRQLSLDTTIVSVDDNEGWLDLMQERLQDEKLLEFVTFVHAPLESSTHSIDSLDWYDENKIAVALENNAPLDLVLVDGPMAWQSSLRLARYPALPFVWPHLAAQFCICLDDTHRKGEQAVLKAWQSKYNIDFREVNSTFSHYVSGQAFIATP